VLLPRDMLGDDSVEAPEMGGATREHICRYVTEERGTSSGCIGGIVERIAWEEH